MTVIAVVLFPRALNNAVFTCLAACHNINPSSIVVMTGRARGLLVTLRNLRTRKKTSMNRSRPTQPMSSCCSFAPSREPRAHTWCRELIARPLIARAAAAELHRAAGTLHQLEATSIGEAAAASPAVEGTVAQPCRLVQPDSPGAQARRCCRQSCSCGFGGRSLRLLAQVGCGGGR